MVLIINDQTMKVMHCASSNATKWKHLTLFVHNHVCLHNGINLSLCQCDPLEQVDNYKYLGVTIDKNLRFDTHIKRITSNLRKVSYQFFHIKDMISKKVLMTMYNALVESSLRYGVTLWGLTSNVYKKELVTVQNNIIKIIHNSSTLNKNMEIKCIYKSLGILPLDALVNYIIIVDNYFKDTHKKVKTTKHIMESRQKDVYHVPHYYNHYGKNKLDALVPRIFNKLPYQLKTLTSISEVKLKIKTHLLQIDGQ